jgi:hypothetical protein
MCIKCIWFILYNSTKTILGLLRGTLWLSGEHSTTELNISSARDRIHAGYIAIYCNNFPPSNNDDFITHNASFVRGWDRPLICTSVARDSNSWLCDCQACILQLSLSSAHDRIHAGYIAIVCQVCWKALDLVYCNHMRFLG